jgi:hypothetical protein
VRRRVQLEPTSGSSDARYGVCSLLTRQG